MPNASSIILLSFGALICGCESDVPTVDAYTGEWIQRNGERVCDGYMTRDESKDYCVADVPKDWQPFTFEGKTYYRQPLDYSVELNETE